MSDENPSYTLSNLIYASRDTGDGLYPPRNVRKHSECALTGWGACVLALESGSPLLQRKFYTEHRHGRAVVLEYACEGLVIPQQPSNADDLSKKLPKTSVKIILSTDAAHSVSVEVIRPKVIGIAWRDLASYFLQHQPGSGLFGYDKHRWIPTAPIFLMTLLDALCYVSIHLREKKQRKVGLWMQLYAYWLPLHHKPDRVDQGTIDSYGLHDYAKWARLIAMAGTSKICSEGNLGFLNRFLADHQSLHDKFFYQVASDWTAKERWQGDAPNSEDIRKGLVEMRNDLLKIFAQVQAELFIIDYNRRSSESLSYTVPHRFVAQARQTL